MSKTNSLVKNKEFQQVLKNYQPNQDNLEFTAKMEFVFMVGPTASGRNTLIDILVESGRYRYIISDTTRYPRPNNGVMEVNGREYWFVSEDSFLSGLEKGEYLEAAIIHEQQVSGISLRELKETYKTGKIAIDEIEVEGALTLRKLFPKSLFVFLLPPSFEIWMDRLNSRGDMHEEEFKRRLTSALYEIESAIECDFYQFVINNEIHEAATAVDELAKGRQPDSNKQAHGIEHAKNLVNNIKQYLATL
jgi:guanylate kinase